MSGIGEERLHPAGDHDIGMREWKPDRGNDGDFFHGSGVIVPSASQRVRDRQPISMAFEVS